MQAKLENAIIHGKKSECESIKCRNYNRKNSLKYNQNKKEDTKIVEKISK